MPSPIDPAFRSADNTSAETPLSSRTPALHTSSFTAVPLSTSRRIGDCVSFHCNVQQLLIHSTCITPRLLDQDKPYLFSIFMARVPIRCRTVYIVRPYSAAGHISFPNTALQVSSHMVFRIISQVDYWERLDQVFDTPDVLPNWRLRRELLENIFFSRSMVILKNMI
jgi:hypothetical protein